jgi:hypothetical protein
VNLALMAAAEALVTPDQAPTLRELAAHACVGVVAARRTTSNLCRAGKLHIVRTRCVPYRNRPIAEYAAVHVNTEEGVSLGTVLTLWGRSPFAIGPKSEQDEN